MAWCKKCCLALFDCVIEYPTAKIVTVKSLKIGLFNRFVQLLVLAYVIGYAIVVKKGYQEFDGVQSSVTTKLKGIGSTLNRSDLPVAYRRIWDTADYVVPPQENNAFFVLTNVIITPNQTKAECPEDPLYSKCNRTTQFPCFAGEPIPTGNGIMTGRCVPYNETNDTCEISAWCPVERNELPNPDIPLLPDAANFTVLIKNMIEFPKFGIKRRNIWEKINNDSYLRRCQYDVATDPYCPVFRLGYIMELAGARFEDLAKLGAVINIVISWDCNLDFDATTYCMPQYRFARLDTMDTKISPGYNFRYASYYRGPNGTDARDLIKPYGILFVFTVQGKAGKFSIVPLILNIGAGLALLALATFVSDFLLLYVVKNRKIYEEKKYLKVVDADYGVIRQQNPMDLESGDMASGIMPADSMRSLFRDE